MSWTELVSQAAETIMAAFGQPATVNGLHCRVIIIAASQMIGVYEQIVETHPVMIFLRSEIAELDAGDSVEVTGGATYTVVSLAEDHSDINQIAYWVAADEL